MTRQGRLASSWKAAADALGITVVAPCSITVDGMPIKLDAHVHQLGAPEGMLVVSTCEKIGPHLGAAWAAGFGFSVLSEPLGEECVDLRSFEEVLWDWGWTGPEEDRPTWDTVLRLQDSAEDRIP